MNRRTFVSLAGLAGSGVVLGLPDLFGADSPQGESEMGDPTRVLAIPDAGWRLWPDVHAEWRNDRIYLPDEVELARLPRNAPTGGWRVLDGRTGREVTLPATVEQFYWGAFGFRPYHDEYKFEATDDQVKNGSYLGVSWWWRTIEIPAALIGRRLLLHVRGARQRAEVYLNQQLVGYSILEELPFECDLTGAAKAGVNQLAIRVTNPGGRLDWVDGNRLNWAGRDFQKSHGFGGLDRGLVVTAHGAVRVADAWVLNTPAVRTVSVHGEVENIAGADQTGHIRFSVFDPATQRPLVEADIPLVARAGKRTLARSELSAPTAVWWDLRQPRLYELRVTWSPDDRAQPAEVRVVPFGFRWLGVDGLGRDAVIRLNGRRIRIYTSISWGFWALNGLFPTPELAEKEVRAAQALNLNCLNFHRNVAKEDVLALQDRAGLLRCLEPGGGSQAVATRTRPEGFAERYMQAKIVHMIRAFRSHPSVAHYIIQNEGRVDPSNPALLALFAMMHAEDPSRTIIGTDGFVMRSPQAWEAAYDPTVRRTDQPATVAGGAAGWWVDHSGHATDVWQDGCYVSPQDYYYRSSIRGEIVEWGEMKGPASSDDHASVLAEIRRHGGASYDRLDHEEILAAYDAFLDRWGFRGAFPTSAHVFRSIGRRAYESWGQLMENVRISDETDMAAISGWESTAIENHSGLVDNFRDFKADPRAIAESLLPVRPVAKQRHLVLAPGDRAVFDIYLLNDSGGAVTGELVFSLTAPDGSVTHHERFSCPAFERDRLSYLVREAVTSEPLRAVGSWRARLALTGRPEVTHERELLVVGLPPPAKQPRSVGLLGVPADIVTLLRGIPGLVLQEYRPEIACDVMVFGGGSEVKRASLDGDGAEIARASALAAGMPASVLAAIRRGTPLLALASAEGPATAVARQLADEGAFRFDGLVGSSRASWMGAWYFVRQHALYEGLPVNEALGLYYQVKSSGSNGWRVEGPRVEIVAGYGRDHDRHLGAGTLTTTLGSTPIVLHHITGMHPVFLRRFLANAIAYLT